MDSFDEESTFQYYTIKNEADSLIDIEENLLDLPSVSDIDTKPIFYLTFNEKNTLGEDDEEEEEEEEEEKTEEEQNDGTIFQMANIEETNQTLDFNTTDVKLITLGDGRMFVTTDKNLEALQANSQLIISETDDNSQNLEETLVENQEESLDDESNYQLVQLADGSHTIVKIFQEQPLRPRKPTNRKTKKFHCCYEGCDKVYASSYHLTVHMRKHTDCKPFKCTTDGCSKKFSTNYSLKAHIRTHTGEKPYGCPLCSKHFKTSGDLHKHVRIHTGEKPFECPIEGCGRSFTTSNIRKVHIRSHTGERPYSCPHPDCGKAFTSATNYKNHLRIHSGEKPYVCPVEGCGKRFTEYSSLYKHNSVHQPVRPYTCTFCGQKYKMESALNFHKRFKHDVMVTKDGTEIIVKID